MTKRVEQAILAAFPGAKNAYRRKQIKTAIETTGSVESLKASFIHVTYGTLGLREIELVLRCEADVFDAQMQKASA